MGVVKNEKLRSTDDGYEEGFTLLELLRIKRRTWSTTKLRLIDELLAARRELEELRRSNNALTYDACTTMMLVENDVTIIGTQTQGEIEVRCGRSPRVGEGIAFGPRSDIGGVVRAAVFGDS